MASPQTLMLRAQLDLFVRFFGIGEHSEPQEAWDELSRRLLAYVSGNLREWPSPILGERIAVDAAKPPPNVQAYNFALATVQQNGHALPPGETLRAFQVLVSARGGWTRLNSGIRGLLTGHVGPHPENPKLARLESRLELLSDEPPESSLFTVIQAHEPDGIRAMVWWNALPSIFRRTPNAALVRMIDRSLPPGGPRRRWRGLQKTLDPREMKSLLWLTRELPPEKIAFEVLELTEKGALAGLPSRRSGLKVVPLPEEANDDPASPGPLVVEPEASAEQTDLERALGGLNERSQVILKLHGEGLTEREIAAHLGISQQAVNKTRRNALAQLRKRLEG